MKTKFTLFLFLSLFLNFLNAQKGTLSGIVKDAEMNDPLPFASISVKDTQIGTTSDFDGAYEIPLDTGTYTILFKFLGYETIEVTGVIIKADNVTNLGMSLKPASGTLEEVVVTAEVAKNTEASVLNVQRRSVNLLDGLSAQNFKKIGASDLAAAVKSVPGVSVQGGKYVYVRGLGDRYTKTILNGVDIPGLDPDRNTIQMDLFSTNILDNILVVKSATADLPADFTGGIVNIITKEYPAKQEYSFSISGSYNSKMHFNNNYLDYSGGDTDFLGYDDGTRSLPMSPFQPIPNTFDNSTLLTDLTRRFSPTMSAQTVTSNMDYSFGVTAGNQFTIGKNDNKLGYIASFSYKNETKFYEGAENNIYRKDPDVSAIEMPLNRSQKGNLGENNIILSGLLGLSYKTDHSKYKGTLMHIQNGESTAGLFTQNLKFTDFVTFKKDNLAYTQRAITNGLLSGTHTNEDASWKTEWKVSGTLSTIYDKDVRTTAFQIEDDNFSIAQNNEPRRIWRNLEEENYVGKLGFTKKYELSKKDAKLKFGAYGSYKQRAYNIYTFRIGIAGPSGFDGIADNILNEENLWTVLDPEGSFVRNTSVAEPANSFEANQINVAGYVSNEFKIGEKLKTIAGLRVEKFMLNYTGQNNTGTIIFNNESIIDKLDFFPSVNFIYGLTDNKNIRLSYSRTTARPSFKEASIAEIFDPLSNTIFVGALANGTELNPTYVNNADLRFEFFGENAQMFAISGFFKSLTDPIELTYFQQDTESFTPRNLGSADVYGLEIELRKNLSFLSPNLEKFRFNINTSIIESKLKMGVDELTLRQNTARVGETVNDTRDLQGQSPYLVNAGFDYDNSEIGLQTGLFYNVQGKTLEVVGGINPDVFTMPYNSLNFTLNKTLGKNKNANLNLKITNLLGEVKESSYQSFNAQDQVFKLRDPGTSISIGYSIKF